jgi:hypothetical protein
MELYYAFCIRGPHFVVCIQRDSYYVLNTALLNVLNTEYISLQEMKQGQCICPICPLSWSVHCNFTGDDKCNKKGVGVNPPPSPAQSNFTLMTECTPESSRYYSVVLKKGCWWGLVFEFFGGTCDY